MTTADTSGLGELSEGQPLDDRVNNRSQKPSNEAYKAFMATGWAGDDAELPARAEVAPYAAKRRRAVGDDAIAFPSGLGSGA